MSKQPVDLSADEIGRAIERLSQHVAGLRRSGPLSVQDAQKVASALTQAKLQLNELERVELQKNGVSKELTGRLAELEHGIRSVREDLSRDLQHRHPGRPLRSDDVKDHAGR
jgi:hypothetical protein